MGACTDRNSRRDIARRYLLALASGLLAAGAFEPLGCHALAWVALVPLLLAVTVTSPLRARALGFVFGCVFYAVTVSWLFRIFSAAAVGLFGVLAVPLWLWGALFHASERRFGATAALLLAPVVWVAADLLRCELWFLRFSWAQLGFSQVDNYWVLQTVSVLGVYGLTLVVVLVNGLLAALWRARGPKVGLSAGVAVMALALAVGLLPHRAPIRSAAPGIRASVLQQEMASPLSDVREVIDAGGADLICWPEYALPEYLLEDERLLAEVRHAAAESGAVLAIGCKEDAAGAPASFLDRLRGGRAEEDRPYYNTCLVFSPDGEVLGGYHKHYPIQFFQDGRPGRELPVIDTPVGKLGVAICYDMTFSMVTRELTRRGAEVLLVPALDDLPWGQVQRRQHAEMARARAVEHRRWLLRPTTYGVSQIIAPTGAEAGRHETRDSGVLRANVERRVSLTVHDRVLWTLPHICLLVTLFYAVAEVARSLVRRVQAPGRNNGRLPRD